MKIQLILLLSAALLSCTSPSWADQREEILATLKALNSAENQSIDLGLARKIAQIDSTMSDDWEGWSNGEHATNRAAERESEQVLFSIFPDYRRSFELIVVEPPYANVLWTITGTAANSYKLSMQGSTTFEFDANSRIIRSWLHTGQMPDPADIGLSADGP